MKSRLSLSQAKRWSSCDDDSWDQTGQGVQQGQLMIQQLIRHGG